MLPDSMGLQNFVHLFHLNEETFFSKMQVQGVLWIQSQINKKTSRTYRTFSFHLFTIGSNINHHSIHWTLQRNTHTKIT